jgi:hypothetical protein
MTAFVGDHPDTGSDEAGPEGIQGPEGEFGGTIKDRVWELDHFRVDAGVNEGGGLVDSSQGNKIRDAEGVYASDLVCQRE